MTPREQAALAVAHAEAALLDARKTLREVVKEEIAAMPPLAEPAYPAIRIHGDEARFRAVEKALRLLPWTSTAPGGSVCWYSLWGSLYLTAQSDGTPLLRAGVDDCVGYFPVTESFDAAVKAALLFLADRDVFVEVTR